jgi:hypothetical protein
LCFRDRVTDRAAHRATQHLLLSQDQWRVDKKKESSEVVHLAMMATTRVPINNAQVVRR